MEHFEVSENELRIRKTGKVRKTGKMKKYIFAALVGLLALCLAACTVQHSVTGTAENLPELVVGCDEYAPFAYFGKNNEIVGIDIDLAKEVCRRIGRKFVFKKIKWNEKNSWLESGEVDCVWGAFSMSGREDDYLWAGPYYVSNQVVVVRADSGITALSELDGKRVAVQSGTKPEKIFLERSMPNVPDVGKVFSFVHMDETFAALSRGYVDACSGHEEAFYYYMRNLSESYRVLPESVATSEIGAAFVKGGDSNLASRVNEALEDMKNDGTVKKIVDKYIPKN